jgi:hypothetical protein
LFVNNNLSFIDKYFAINNIVIDAEGKSLKPRLISNIVALRGRVLSKNPFSNSGRVWGSISSYRVSLFCLFLRRGANALTRLSLFVEIKKIRD